MEPSPLFGEIATQFAEFERGAFLCTLEAFGDRFETVCADAVVDVILLAGQFTGTQETLVIA